MAIDNGDTVLGVCNSWKTRVIPTVGYAGMYWFIPAFLGGFLGGWLVLSVRAPKWMLWAYPRVHNLTELKACAIEAQILWPDGSMFNRTLIMSKVERQELRKLSKKQMKIAVPNPTFKFVPFGAGTRLWRIH